MAEGAPIQGDPRSPSVGADVTGLVLISTALTTILTYVPFVPGGFSLKGSVVVGGPSPVVATIRLTWQDPVAGPQTQDFVLPSTVLSPGVDSLAPFPFSAQAGTAIRLQVQVSIANVVSVTASLERLV